jgi:hypothetical protein
MNRYLAAFLALLCTSITVSSACFAQASDRASRVVRCDDIGRTATHAANSLALL